ncbi:hypothetical protein ACJMK2_043519 [Sinanodonta woodiana]|uniref:Protein kinase domain-containing protein n=1 Tax=Sinanodonta woodiana TaxID=1069815 RepID=A0ABD3W0C7_SINWO
MEEHKTNQGPLLVHNEGAFTVDPRFTDLQPVGHGGHGVVYAAVDSDCDKAVAIKKLAFADKRTCKYVLREVRIMRRLQHDNIVTVYEVLGPDGYSIDRTSSGGPQHYCDMTSIYLVQELLHTDLHQLIATQQLTDEHTKLFLYQILRGLKYIHSANILHRDLKPGNLLVNVEDLVLKIADFGLARVVDPDYVHKGFLTDGLGTCWYRSPELIISPRDYTKAVDIWSVGCIFGEMLVGKPLFPGAHEMDQIGRIIDAIHLSDNEWNKISQILPMNILNKHNRVPVLPLKEQFKDADPNALDLLEKLLIFEPSKRITSEEALAHPYLSLFSCPEDEPVALKKFQIEHEVDDLSPKTLRRIISIEITNEVETCGIIYPTSSNNLKNSSMELKELISDASAYIEEYFEAEPNSSSGIVLEEKSLIGDKNKSNSDSVYNLLQNDKNRSNSLNGLDILPDDKPPAVVLDFQPVIMPRLSEDFKQLRVIVDLQDNENGKDQNSPKETIEDKLKNDEESHESKSKDAKVRRPDRLIVELENTNAKRKSSTQKDKDRLNEEKRAEGPKERLNKAAKEVSNTSCDGKKKDQAKFVSTDRKSSKFKHEKKKKNHNNKYSSVDEDSRDFDALYRLPTEHLTGRRNRHNNDIRKNVERQLRLHEQLNERLRRAELEKERCIGAVGGVQGSPVEWEESDHPCGHGTHDGNISPNSEHSRESSPSSENNSFTHRWEK